MSIREDLKAYLDGELPPERIAEVRAALDADPALKAEAEFMGKLGTAIRSISNEPEIVGIEKVLGAFGGRSRPNPWFRVNWAWTGAAAGVVLVLVVAAALRPLLDHSEQFAAESKASAPNDAVGKVLAPSYSPLSNSAPQSYSEQTRDARGPRAASDAATGASPGSAPIAPAPAGPGTSKPSPGRAVITLPDEVDNVTVDPKAARAGSHFEWDRSSAAGGTVMLANISIQAVDVDKAEAAVRRVAEHEGGISEPTRMTAGRNGVAAKQMAFSVPAPRLNAVLQNLKSVGRVLAQSLRSFNLGSHGFGTVMSPPVGSKAAGDSGGQSGVAGGVSPLHKFKVEKGVDEEIQTLVSRQKPIVGTNPMPVVIATIEAVTPGMPPPARYVPRAPKPRSRLPVVLGTTLAVVVFGGLGILAWLRLRRVA